MNRPAIIGFVILSDYQKKQLKESAEAIKVTEIQFREINSIKFRRHETTYQSINDNIRSLIMNANCVKYKFTCYMLTMIKYQILFIIESISSQEKNELFQIITDLYQIHDVLQSILDNSTFTINEIF